MTDALAHVEHPMSDDLEPVSVAKELIARAVWEHDAETLLELRSRASAFELYHRRAGARELSNDAGEIKVRAERGLGSVDTLENPRGRPEKDPGVRNFSLDVHKDTRAAWRKLGALADETFDRYVEQVRADENQAVSTAALIGILRLGGTLSSTTFECYTPAEYVEAARDALGAIDLDPASSAEANETVQAARYYTALEDGLEQPWSGRVWLNPPYGRSHHAAFATRLVEEYRAGHVTAGIILLNAYGFDAAWFQPLWDGQLCFTDHRIRFYGGGPTFGSLFVYLGPDPDRFSTEFTGFGAVVRRVA